MKERLKVVGIGASAGGLEALQDFFKNMPLKTGLAFVVIQHLSPDYKSLMDELLARQTKIPVQIAEDGVKLIKDNIYLIPPRKNLSIFHDKLYLDEQNKVKGLNLPIDIFFRSLAKEKGKDAIGIVLSGTGSDGTLGIKAIKEAGGMVMVQDEHSAKFDGMPRNAIATGLVDYILPAHKIPGSLVEFLKHPFIKQETTLDEIDVKSLDTFTKILMILRNSSGIDFSYYKESTILRRLERRVSINRFGTLEDYMDFLNESEKEKDTLNRELLIGVTRFFRDQEAFDSLKKNVFPKIAEKKSIRIWSAGCSTGEEVYSLAIMLNEYLEKEKLEYEVKIFATDIDRNSIEYAGKGFYPESIVADVEPELLNKYFSKVESGYLINDSIRKNIVFAVHNILKDSPFSKLDLMVCRNLFIYFKPEVQTRMLSLIYYSIRPDGYMFLGSSETVGEMSEGFETLDTKWKIYKYKKGYAAPLIKDLSPFRVTTGDAGRFDTMHSSIKGVKKEKFFDGIMSDILPPSVIIDDSDNIVHIFNDVSPFVKMQPGRFSNNLFNNLSKELAPFVSAALRKLRKKNESHFIDKVYALSEKDKKAVVVEGRRLFVEKNTYFLISFSVEDNPEKVQKVKKESVVSESDIERIDDLEKELQIAKESLQATVEELETSNEELQSSNEELIASNEELQSTNEELQSVNEELYTVNSEYQVKIDELTKLNNDINNLLVNTEVGAIYLDRNLCIRKITPIVSEVTNILNTDVGRPFAHITIVRQKNQLLKDIKKVGDNLRPVDRELVLKNKKTYLVRIMPYRTEYNSVEGILITFYDISHAKELEEDIKERKDLFEKILNFSPVAKTMVDKDGQITYVNKAAEKLFEISAKEVNSRTYDSLKWEITDVDGNMIDAEDLPFAKIKKTKKPVSDYFHYISVAGKKRKLLRINGEPIIKGRRFEGVVFAIEVIDEKKGK